MGTRCLTVVYDDNGIEILNLYRHCDGYPDAHGVELSEFLKGIRIVNGIPVSLKDGSKIANGMGDLAAQLVAHFKCGVGQFYIEAPGTRRIGEEFIYKIKNDNGRISISAAETP